MSDSYQKSLHPFFLNLEKIPLLIAGSDLKVVRIVREILEATPKAKIEIFDYAISDEIKQISLDHPSVLLHDRMLLEEDLNTCAFLVVSAPDHDYEEWIIEQTEGKGILLSILGKPQISDFTIASFLSTSNLRIGVASDSFSYEIQRRINKIIKDSLPTDLEAFIIRLKFAHKHPLMDIGEELKELDRLTAEYLESKKKNLLHDSEFENLAKVNKAVRRRATIYLGIIGVLVLAAFLTYVLIEFNLTKDVGQFLAKDDHMFYKMLLLGFLAEIVAGSMGMGYGVLCTTVLLIMNVSPPVVSASIHSAETFTSAAGSISHYKLRNVNKKMVWALAPAAIIGAIIGALSLSYFGEEYAHIVKPIISCYTLYLGVNILRNAFKRKEKKIKKQKTKTNLKVLGLVGGFIDSFAGGGWGPLVTGTLMKDGRTPRYVVGSSTLSKFILTITSAVTFVYTLGITHIHIIMGLLIGGIITAPFSAMLTAKLPVKRMFIIIGTLVILMSLTTIIRGIL